MKQSKKLGLATIVAGIIIVFGSTCLVTGCGGGSSGGNDSGGGNQPPVTPPPDTNGLPPDPGAEGNATREGIDSNGNNVRDDMEIAIHKRYPDDELKRDALMRGAFVLQKAMLAGGAILDGTGSRDRVFQLSESEGFAVMCLSDEFGSSGLEELGFLENTLVKGSDRGKAYDMYSATASGSFDGLPDTDTPCQDINL